jgi:PAS domain S-box-containing protein
LTRIAAGVAAGLYDPLEVAVHQTEEARLRERLMTETAFDAVLDQLPIGVVIASAPSGRVTHANRYIAELLGGELRPESLADYGRFELFDLRGRPVGTDSLPLVRAIRRGEHVRDEQYEVEASDGKRRLVVVSATPVLDAAGEIIGAVALIEDISEREQRRRADREFVTNAAHELRTPLAAIASAVDVLQAGAKELPAERDLFLGHIERESRRLARLARALLLLARVQTGAEQPLLKVVPLRPLLRDVAAATSTGDGVKLSVRCRKDLAALSSHDLLEQALLNLAGNASRHTTRGRISLTARAVGEHVEIDVRDTGSGISQDDRERIFERFYRGGARDAGGFGLGLSIVHQAIDAVGGEVHLESREGVGTTVRLLLPLAELA